VNDSALLRQLLDNLPDAVFFKDAKGRFLRINRILAEWYGLKDPNKAAGKTEAEFVSPGFARATLENELKLIESGVPLLDQEERFVGRDGKTHWVSTTKLPLRNAKGRIVGTLGISRDIKGVKRAEEKVRDSDALYQSLIESLPQCIFRKDADGRYVYVNQNLCELLGVPRQDFLGKTDLDVCPPPLAAKYRRDDQWVMTREKVFEAVEEVQAKRKKIRIRIYKTPVYDSNGRVVGVQGVFSPLGDATL
jgi:two-component system, sensor histidine kinase and response regulator